MGTDARAATMVLREERTGAPTPRPTLSEVLFRKSEGGFRSFAILPSNVAAVETAMLFANGLQPFVALVGPSGWGKTHLLEACAQRLRIDLAISGVCVLSAVDWVLGARLPAPHLPLLLDNVQDVLDKTRCRLRLRLALERRVRAGRPTLLAFTANQPTRQVMSALPQCRNWAVAPLSAPTVAEREVMVSQMALAEGLTVGEPLRRVLARLDGNGRTLSGALKRLRMDNSQWVDTRATVRALGLLNPFFSAHPTWDLKEHILSVANGLPLAEDSGMTSEKLAVYGMLKVASLPEADVARYMNMPPAKAYLMAAKLEEHFLCPECDPALVGRFLERIVEGLQAN